MNCDSMERWRSTMRIWSLLKILHKWGYHLFLAWESIIYDYYVSWLRPISHLSAFEPSRKVPASICITACSRRPRSLLSRSRVLGTPSCLLSGVRLAIWGIYRAGRSQRGASIGRPSHWRIQHSLIVLRPILRLGVTFVWSMIFVWGWDCGGWPKTCRIARSLDGSNWYVWLFIWLSRVDIGKYLCWGIYYRFGSL